MSCCAALSEGFARVRTLFASSPRELWIIYVALFLESFSYFSTSLILTSFLTDEFGLSDSEAGFSYGVFGTLVSVCSILVGALVDKFGVRRSLIFSSLLLVLARVLIAIAKDARMALGILYTILPLGIAIGSPAQLTGIRRFTTSSTQSLAFSLFYVAMNVAALLSGWIVDILRAVLEVSSASRTSAGTCAAAGSGLLPSNSSSWAPTTAPVPAPVSELGPYRTLLLIGAGVTLVQLLLVWIGMREAADVEAPPQDSNVSSSASPTPTASYWATVTDILCEPERRFWRFLLFVTLLTGVKQVFRHLDATIPKYLVRSIGCDAPFGTIYSINPLLIIVLVPVITSVALQMQLPMFTQIVMGASLSGIAPFILSIADGSYVAVVLFVVTLSVGEALWSPRLLEYSATISPKGSEGTYLALGSIPQFLAKFFVGLMSGALLQRYCPCSLSECEPCCANAALVNGTAGCADGQTLWAIIGASTVLSPILIVALKSVIERGACITFFAFAPFSSAGKLYSSFFNRPIMSSLLVLPPEGSSSASDTDFALLEPHLADAFRSDAVWTSRLSQSLASSPSEALPSDNDAHEGTHPIASGDIDVEDSHAPIGRMSLDQSEHAGMLDERDDASESDAYFAVSSSNQNA